MSNSPIEALRRLKPAVKGARLRWNLKFHMERLDYRSTAELHAALKEIDPLVVNYSQFTNFVQRIPERISSRTLLALLILLGCEVGELIVIDRDNEE